MKMSLARNLLSSSCGRHATRLHIMWIHARILPTFDLNMALSIAIGASVEPEVIGELYDMLLQHFAPKDIKPVPRQLFVYAGDAAFVEHHVYKEWLKSYLKYISWYYLLTVNRGKLDVFLKPPLYNREYRNRSPEPEKARSFGVMFKLYDWCKKGSKE